MSLMIFPLARRSSGRRMRRPAGEAERENSNSSFETRRVQSDRASYTAPRLMTKPSAGPARSIITGSPQLRRAHKSPGEKNMTSETDLHEAQLILLLLLVFVAAFGALARKLHIPYPMVLVIGGLLLEFVPGIPRINLDPELIFLVVLPPLLYAAAWQTSWRDLSHNAVSVAMLAFGLAGIT